jgi:hypothetical protein
VANHAFDPPTYPFGLAAHKLDCHQHRRGHWHIDIDSRSYRRFETEDGRHAFLLKTEIARIDPHDRVEPAAGNRANEWSRFDANHARVVLGVAADATEHEIHAARRDLAKAYHPDQWTFISAYHFDADLKV